MRLDPLAGDAADVRELLGVDQGNQPMKGVGLALVRGGRKHQEIWRGLRESLPQFEAGNLIGAAAESVRFVHDDQVPAGGNKILESFAVVLTHLGSGPATALVQGLDRIHRHDHLWKHGPRVAGHGLRVFLTRDSGLGTRDCRNAAKRFDIIRQDKLKTFVEVGLHFGHPLAHQSLRGDDERPLDQASELKFPHDETGLDGLAQTDLVRQEIAHPVVGDGAG